MPRGNPYDRKTTPPKKAPAEKQSAFEWLQNRPRTSFQGPTAFESVQARRPAPSKTPTTPRSERFPMRSGATTSPKPAPKAPAKAAAPTPSRTSTATSRPSTTTSSTPAKFVKTKGGDYPMYEKKSDEAKSFRSAFAAARKGGAKTFMWEGRKYTTELKK